MASSKLGTVVVLGGGISGLTAAYRLTKANPTPARVILLEASNRLGGWIHSSRFQDGVIYEHGPRTLRPAGEAGIASLNLVEELELRDKVISVPSNHPSAKNRFIYVDGELVRLPTELSWVFKARPPFKSSLLAAGFKDLITKKKPRKRREHLRLFRGICAGDAREISVNFLLKPLKEAEQAYGRITLGLVQKALANRKKTVSVAKATTSDLVKQARSENWSVWSLNEGLQTLPEALARKVIASGVEVYTESPCTRLEFKSAGGVSVFCNDHEFVASNVVSALPAPTLASLTRAQHPILSDMLESIESVTVGVVNLEWSGRKLDKDAFGFLVPSSQLLPILGIVFDSCSFPQGDRTILTVMMGGKWFNTLFGNEPTEERLLNVALQQVSFVLGIEENPVRAQVHILKNCIPQYVVGHYDRVQKIREYVTDNRLDLNLIGASYDGVSVNDCIHNANLCVDSIAQKAA
nr:EOG090X06SP [Eulimnadia texana]